MASIVTPLSWMSRHKLLAAAAATKVCIVSLWSVVRVFAAEKREYFKVRVASGDLRETQEYYAANTIPQTFDKWKAKYGVPSQRPGESLDGFRERTGVAVYYNANELGLGRELGCGTFSDTSSSGNALTGLACYVTNYGQQFEDAGNALADAVAGKNPKGHDAYVFAPASTRHPRQEGLRELPANSYAVQFAAYDAQGNLIAYANLDPTGARAVPQVCTNCHGGTYDPADRLVIGAVFTPINPSILRFSSQRGYTLADQTARITRLNALMAAPGSGRPPNQQTGER